jgi:hypothetical protein
VIPDRGDAGARAVGATDDDADGGGAVVARYGVIERDILKKAAAYFAKEST